MASFPAQPFVSGYAERAHTLAGSAVEAVDRVGAGSVTVFSVEPNLRGYTDGTAQLLPDAMLGTPTPDPAATSAATPDAAAAGVAAPAGPPLRYTTAERQAHEDAGRD